MAAHLDTLRRWRPGKSSPSERGQRARSATGARHAPPRSLYERHLPRRAAVVLTRLLSDGTVQRGHHDPWDRKQRRTAPATERPAGQRAACSRPLHAPRGLASLGHPHPLRGARCFSLAVRRARSLPPGCHAGDAASALSPSLMPVRVRAVVAASTTRRGGVTAARLKAQGRSRRFSGSGGCVLREASIKRSARRPEPRLARPGRQAAIPSSPVARSPRPVAARRQLRPPQSLLRRATSPRPPRPAAWSPTVRAGACSEALAPLVAVNPGGPTTAARPRRSAPAGVVRAPRGSEAAPAQSAAKRMGSAGRGVRRRTCLARGVARRCWWWCDAARNSLPISRAARDNVTVPRASAREA